MGGEIEIADKGVGEKGTCFRFNTYLSSICEDGNVRDYDIESYSSYISGASYGQSTQFHSPKVEASQVVLFIQSEERLKVAKKTMERYGINVSAVKRYELFSSTLKNIKQKLLLSPNNSSANSISDCLSRAISGNSSTRSKEVPLSELDGSDQAPSTKRRTSRRTTTSFILIVIDTNGGPFRDLSRAVAEFRKDLCNICSRVVWIDRPGASNNIHSQGLDEDKLPPNDLIIFKPFHGSRFHQLIGILPEFGGVTQAVNVETLHHFSAGNVAAEASTSGAQMRPNLTQNSSAQKHGSEIEEIGGPSNEKPLNGKKVLVAEDDPVLRKIGSSVISKLGATVELCVNGQEALETVRKGLNDQRNCGAPHVLPYDFVFMDCEMPIMDGFEATRQIRQEEEHYGVHIPIIAVSAHTNGPELRMMIQAGMDHHLPKPLNPTKVMQVLVDIHGR